MEINLIFIFINIIHIIIGSSNTDGHLFKINWISPETLRDDVCIIFIK